MNKIKQETVKLAMAINLVMINIFGVFTPLLYLVILLMMLDLVTRVYAASSRQDERAESRKVMKGLYRKLGLCLLIVLSLILDLGLKEIANHLGIHITTKIIFTALTLAWLFVRELISNLENLQWAGIELPSFIIKAITLTQEKVEQVGQTIVEENDKIENSIRYRDDL